MLMGGGFLPPTPLLPGRLAGAHSKPQPVLAKRSKPRPVWAKRGVEQQKSCPAKSTSLSTILCPLKGTWAVWPERLRPDIQTPTRALGQLLAPLNECVAFGLNGFKCSWVLACAPRYYWVLSLCACVLLGSSCGAPGREPYTRRRVAAGHTLQ